MDRQVAKYKKYLKKVDAFEHALGVLNYDFETVMPKAGADHYAETVGTLSEELYRMETDPELKKLVQDLYDGRDGLDEVTRREVEEHRDSIAKIDCIPIKEYTDYSRIQSEASAVWHKAKVENDFASFRPYLQKVIDYRKKFALYYAPDKDPYDTLLDEYEKGLTQKTLDDFFAKIAGAFRPLIEKTSAARGTIRDDFLSRFCPIEKQRELSDYIMKVMCIDRNCCSIGEVEHPFTSDFCKHDVRITTHYYDNKVASSFFSVIHEGGHALYELHTGDDLIGSPLGTGASMGMHESQSRLYENILGRSESFINLVFPKIEELFPDQMKDVTAKEFYRAVNKSVPSLIRTEADELTYCFHIMIRYNLEKKLISGNMKAEDLPSEWDRLYGEYLGITVPSDREGVLQDSHWSSGLIGYFPSYAIGSAYGAQFMASMRKDVDVDGTIEAGDLRPVNEWLTEKIWKYGMLKKPAELIRGACGADFDPGFFIRYITDKINGIYGF